MGMGMGVVVRPVEEVLWRCVCVCVLGGGLMGDDQFYDGFRRWFMEIVVLV